MGVFSHVNRLRLLVIALVLVLPSLMLHHLWAAPTSVGEDDLIYYYPLRKMVGQSLREGRWPLHNALEATGMPLMADPQAAVMYPPTWMFAAMAPRLAYSITLLMAFSIAGAGAYLYLRRLGLVRPAACFGAVAFMFCGFLVGHRVHWSMLHAAAWLPWALWAIELLRQRPWTGAAALAPVGYLMITAGHWPTLIHMTMVLGAYLLLRGRPAWRALPPALAAGALAVAMAWPQVDLTRQLLAAATRERIGYAMAGENSFFPPSAALEMFPFLFGTRAQGFYPQPWWGPWHLCETLGYVGLATLVLAGAAVWTWRRESKRENRGSRNADCGFPGRQTAAPGEAGSAPSMPSMASMTSIVRVWTWLGIAAGIWMLGYYLPTYKLVHMLPVLGVVRCPARMILAVDMALATLAAVAIHRAIVSKIGTHPIFSTPASNKIGTHPIFGALPQGSAFEKIGCVPIFETVRRGTVVLPAVMVGTLLLLAAAGWVSVTFFGGAMQFFDGGGSDALRAVVPTSPAVWVPLVLAAVTALVVRAWLRRPAERAPALVCLLLLDLFFVTRFVDVPGDWMSGGPDAEKSPAGSLVRDSGQREAEGRKIGCVPIFGEPEGEEGRKIGCVPILAQWRAWGIGADYDWRANELLLPKVACSLGVATINTYGPFQSPALPHLMGFRIFGTNRNWAWLLRENRLLSLYGVKYILTDRADVQAVIESVRVPQPHILTDRADVQAVIESVRVPQPRVLTDRADVQAVIESVRVPQPRVLTDRADVRAVIESVRVPQSLAEVKPSSRPAEPGLELLAGKWTLDRAEMAEGVIRMRTEWLWNWSVAKQAVDGSAMEPNATYRIALNARAPAGGAANFLRADLLEAPEGRGWRQREELALVVHEEEMGAGWRHYEWTFRAPADMAKAVQFRLFTMSERPIEVRNVSLRRAEATVPRWAEAHLLPGEQVYRKLAELPALDGRSAPVTVYENRLAVGASGRPRLRKMTGAEIEAVKWSVAVPEALPDLGLRVEASPAPAMWKVTVPATAAWVLLLAGITLVRWREERRRIPEKDRIPDTGDREEPGTGDRRP